tara:strand:+ start:446 stop:841 length:396 start_codon:yes stop_codon:yes gene_type:complete
MKVLDCSDCGTPVKTNADTITVICHQCVIESWGNPPKFERKRIGYPKGWKFMKEFVHVDGTVYNKGIEQPALKGKLKPTELKVKVKKSVRERETEKLEKGIAVTKLKKELKKTTKASDQVKIQSAIKKLQS